jgi:hypothetical protein
MLSWSGSTCSASGSKSTNAAANKTPAAKGVAYFDNLSALFSLLSRKLAPNKENKPPIRENTITVSIV